MSLQQLADHRRERVGAGTWGSARPVCPARMTPIPALLRLRNLAIGHDIDPFCQERYNPSGELVTGGKASMPAPASAAEHRLPRCPHQLKTCDLLADTHRRLKAAPRRRWQEPRHASGPAAPTAPPQSTGATTSSAPRAMLGEAAGHATAWGAMRWLHHVCARRRTPAVQQQGATQGRCPGRVHPGLRKRPSRVPLGRTSNVQCSGAPESGITAADVDHGAAETCSVAEAAQPGPCP